MNVETVTTFGQWLKLRRKALDLTQEMVAHQVGCSLAAIKKIESGERRPSRQIAQLLAEHLNIPPKQQAAFISAARGEFSAYDLPSPYQEPFSPRVLSASPAHQVIKRWSLPTPAALLIGREHELAETVHLLQDPQCRLLTLTGPGGIGKTRLALEIAHHLQAAFPDGVGFISLIGVSSPEFIVPAIASELGFTFSGPANPKTQLLNYLKAKNCLLVLDNLEHLLDGVAIIAELLQYAPGVRLLTTSREQLHLQAEWILEIQGLPIPQSAQAEHLETVSAAALFLQRARQSRIGFTLSDADRPALVRICQLVKGMPLAIELAAAWTRTLTCQEIAQEIERGLDFLSGNTRDVPERHRSITAVFDHSWKLLSQHEQDALKRLAVFRGGFSREAAEKVARASLPLLSGLVDKSLIQRGNAGRYEMHELVCQYLSARLNENPEEEQIVCQQHCHYYLTLLQSREHSLKSMRQKETIAELKTEIDNIRLAWNTAVENGSIDLLDAAARSLQIYYELYQYFKEAETTFNYSAEKLQARLVALHTERGSPESRRLETTLGAMLSYQGFFTLRPGNYREALVLFQSSLALLRPKGNSIILAFAIIHFGAVYMALGDFEAASYHLKEGLTVSRQSGDSWLEAMALGLLGGVLHNQGNYDEAYRSLSESISLCQVIGDPYLTLLMGFYYSHTALVVGRLLDTQDLFRDSVRSAQETGNRWGVGTGLMILSAIAQLKGKNGEARALLEESIALNREVGDLWSLAWSLNDLSRLALQQRDFETAERCALEAFKIMMESGNQATALDALTILASIRSQQGLNSEAFELTRFILLHPGGTRESRDRANDLQTKFVAIFTPAQIEAAQLRARSMSFEGLAGELLKG